MPTGPMPSKKYPPAADAIPAAGGDQAGGNAAGGDQLSLRGLDPKHAQVWEQLDTVADPELDQSVVAMKFISAVTIYDDKVDIQFRLPTYWCAANFAFMMADDMHSAVSALPWVKGVSVVLDEHMYADAINRGIAGKRSFVETFGDEADGNLDDVRRIFLLKAFQRRQEAVLQHLLGLGHTPDTLVAMTLGELNALSLDAAGTKARARYLERRGVAGPKAGRALDPGAPAFVTTDGAPLTASIYAQHLKALRSVRVNAEFNGALCSGLLDARYEFDTTTPLKSKRRAKPDSASCGPATPN